MLSSEEKRRFLKALETDEEFRLAVAGLPGLGEILQQLKDLRAHMDRYIKLNEKRWKNGTEPGINSSKNTKNGGRRIERGGRGSFVLTVGFSLP